MPDKPTTAAGYESGQVELVRATCLYVATKLGVTFQDHAPTRFHNHAPGCRGQVSFFHTTT